MIKHQEVNDCFLCLFSLVTWGRDLDIECRKEKGGHVVQFLDNIRKFLDNIKRHEEKKVGILWK